jgi:hypothetical protein
MASIVVFELHRTCSRSLSGCIGHGFPLVFMVAISITIQVACTLLKLAQGASLTICSKFFALGVSTVSCILLDIGRAINIELWHEVQWPTSECLVQNQEEFKVLCGLPLVVGAIDGTHVHISKPAIGVEDYYYLKSGGYTFNCQAVVDSWKGFIDLYLEMLGSTNNVRVLCRSSFYRLATHNNLFDPTSSINGFPLYLLGDNGYPSSLGRWSYIMVQGSQTSRKPCIIGS